MVNYTDDPNSYTNSTRQPSNPVSGPSPSSSSSTTSTTSASLSTGLYFNPSTGKFDSPTPVTVTVTPDKPNLPQGVVKFTSDKGEVTYNVQGKDIPKEVGEQFFIKSASASTVSQEESSLTRSSIVVPPNKTGEFTFTRPDYRPSVLLPGFQYNTSTGFVGTKSLSQQAIEAGGPTGFPARHPFLTKLIVAPTYLEGIFAGKSFTEIEKESEIQREKTANLFNLASTIKENTKDYTGRFATGIKSTPKNEIAESAIRGAKVADEAARIQGKTLIQQSTEDVIEKNPFKSVSTLGGLLSKDSVSKSNFLSDVTSGFTTRGLPLRVEEAKAIARTFTSIPEGLYTIGGLIGTAGGALTYSSETRKDLNRRLTDPAAATEGLALYGKQIAENPTEFATTIATAGISGFKYFQAKTPAVKVTASSATTESITPVKSKLTSLYEKYYPQTPVKDIQDSLVGSALEGLKVESITIDNIKYKELPGGKVQGEITGRTLTTLEKEKFLELLERGGQKIKVAEEPQVPRGILGIRDPKLLEKAKVKVDIGGYKGRFVSKPGDVSVPVVESPGGGAIVEVPSGGTTRPLPPVNDPGSVTTIETDAVRLPSIKSLEFSADKGGKSILALEVDPIYGSKRTFVAKTKSGVLKEELLSMIENPEVVSEAGLSTPSKFSKVSVAKSDIVSSSDVSKITKLQGKKIFDALSLDTLGKDAIVKLDLSELKVSSRGTSKSKTITTIRTLRDSEQVVEGFNKVEESTVNILSDTKVQGALRVGGKDSIGIRTLTRKDMGNIGGVSKAEGIKIEAVRGSETEFIKGSGTATTKFLVESIRKSNTELAVSSVKSGAETALKDLKVNLPKKPVVAQTSNAPKSDFIPSSAIEDIVSYATPASIGALGTVNITAREQVQQRRQDTRQFQTPFLRPSQVTSQVPRQDAIERILPKTDLTTTPRTLTTPDTITVTTPETITTLTTLKPKTKQGEPQIPRIETPKLTPGPGKETIFRLPGAVRFPKATTSKALQSFLRGGFKAQVRRKGKFKDVSSSLSKEDAYSFGANFVKNTSAASFRVVPTNEPTGESPILPNVDMSQFRQSTKEPGVIIQRSRFRIGTSGEKKEITYKGLASRKRRGFL